VGLVLGSSGCKVKEMEHEFKVRVYIDRSPGAENSPIRKVDIVGSNEFNVDQAISRILTLVSHEKIYFHNEIIFQTNEINKEKKYITAPIHFSYNLSPGQTC